MPVHEAKDGAGCHFSAAEEYARYGQRWDFSRDTGKEQYYQRRREYDSFGWLMEIEFEPSVSRRTQLVRFVPPFSVIHPQYYEIEGNKRNYWWRQTP